MGKRHSEFRRRDVGRGRVAPEGCPARIRQEILAVDPDEDGGIASRTRVLQSMRRAFKTEPFVQADWEEADLLTGDHIVGAAGAEMFTGPTCACRPPGTACDPCKSETGLAAGVPFFRT